MKILIENNLGAFVPLDLFSDFEIKYTHSFEDSKSISGRKMPYTESFKIPMNKKNRALTGVNFDLTYPSDVKKKGRFVDENNVTVIDVIITISGSETNTIQSYISISVQDYISSVLEELKKTKLSDLYNNVEGDYRHADESISSNPYSFFFPYINLTGHTGVNFMPRRKDEHGVYPVFVLKKLLSDIFSSLGTTYSSKLINDDYYINPNVKSDNLCLLLPTDLKTFTSFSPEFREFAKYSDGLPYGLLMNDSSYGGVLSSDRIGIKEDHRLAMDMFYSPALVHHKDRTMYLTSGKLEVQSTGNDFSFKSGAYIYGAWGSFVDISDANVVSGSLEAFLSDSTFETTDSDNVSLYPSDTSYLVKLGDVSVTAEGERLKYSVTGESDTGFLDVNTGFSTDMSVVLKGDMVIDVTLDVSGSGNYQVIRMTFDGTNVTFDGSYGIYLTPFPFGNEEFPAITMNSNENGCLAPVSTKLAAEKYNIGKSYEKNGNRSLFDVIILIMERFNLLMFIRDGVIHLDTKEEMNSPSEIIYLDALVDESIGSNFIINEQSLLTFSDKINKSEEEGFNSLYEFKLDNSEGKEVLSIGLKSSVMNESLHLPEYTSSSDESRALLKVINDAAYWGLARNGVIKPKDIKPTFGFIKSSASKELRLPTYKENSILGDGCIMCTPSIPYPDGSSLPQYVLVYEKKYPTVGLEFSKDIGGFSMISFKDNSPLAGDVLYNKYYLKKVSNITNKDTVTVTLNVYISESDFKKLLLFPTLKLNGLSWELQDFSDYDISAQYGSMCKLNLIRR